MEGLSKNNNELHIEDISARDLISIFGSPLYVYSEKIIKNRFNELNSSIKYKNKNLLYAMKANSNSLIRKILAKEGAGIDAVSLEEVKIDLKAMFKPEKILFSGINLSVERMKRAIKKSIILHLGSLMQLKFYGKYFLETKVFIRINPDFGA